MFNISSHYGNVNYSHETLLHMDYTLPGTTGLSYITAVMLNDTITLENKLTVFYGDKHRFCHDVDIYLPNTILHINVHGFCFHNKPST